MTTSARIAHLAAKAANPKSKDDITQEEIRELGASTLSQVQDASARPGRAPGEVLFPTALGLLTRR
jgi:hypothetical protein